MPDPIDALENFSTPGLTMEPLSATEVRRRGTRMRRRNHAVATVGIVAAVTLVATPIALAATRTTSSTPPPAIRPPSVAWVQAVPADFPLTEGLPAKNGHDGSPVEARDGYQPQVVDICEGAGWDATGASDVRQATYTGESEGGSDRALALYPTDKDAQSALAAVESRVEACATQTAGRKRFVEVLPSDAGDESLVFADHYTDGGDLSAVQLVRVGNAILFDTSYSIGAPAQDTADLIAEKSTTTVGALCRFSADPC